MAIGQDRAAQSDPLIDRVIVDKFRLRSCVGSGASGTVYQADQIALGRTVAVKILRPELASDPRIVSRFHDEALAASRLNHPNAVSIIDYGQTRDGLLFLVMEFLRGRTLTQVVRDNFPLRTDQVVDLLVQILSGLEEAHHAGVIHADIKADNIVVEHRRGDWDLVKVVDFGVSRILGVRRDEPGDRTIWGTPEYMAPELISGAEPTIASDIYAVGIILYELLAGITPFAAARSVMAILNAHLEEEPASPSSVRADLDISKPLEAIALRAIAKPPRERFASVTEFRDAVAGVLGRRTQAEEDEILCSGCGVLSSASYKFCPECGRPRQQQPSSPASRPTLRLLDLIEEQNEGGIFPLPLLGREPDLAALVDFACGEGEASVLHLVGEPGSGRTRLLRTACKHSAAEDDIRCVLATPDPSGLASPFYPIRSMVAAILELPPICSLDCLRQSLFQHRLSARDLPGIAELFGHEGELSTVEPPIRKREVLAATCRVLRAANAPGERAVLVFEDVDLYDNPSQEFLRRIIEPSSEPGPVRMVVSSRADFASRWTGEVTRVEIGPLDHNALEQMGSHLTRGDNTSPMPDANTLAERTDRLPASIAELARFVVEGGTVDSAPPHTADLIADRIERLPHPALQVAQAAAVLGYELPRDTLLELVGREITSPAFDEALAILSARGLLVVDDAMVGFARNLIRDVVYDATPVDVRRQLHADALRTLRGTTAGSAALGHHHEHAQHLAEAAEMLTRAGDEAIHQFDDLGACRLYQRALTSARRLLLDNADDEARFRFVTLSIKLADTLRVSGEVALARGLVEEAHGHCAGVPSLEAQLLRATAHLLLTEGSIDEALTAFRQAIGLTIPTGQMELLSELYLDLSSTHLRNGQPAAALAELTEGIDVVTLGEGASGEGGPQCLWRLLVRMAQLQSSLDRPARAIELGIFALHHARRVHSLVGSARVQVMLATQYEKVGNLQKAERYRQAAIEEMRRLGDRRGTAELLLAGGDPTRRLLRITPGSLREARELAGEVGWAEGVRRAGRSFN